jgi:hypothetical protein
MPAGFRPVNSPTSSDKRSMSNESDATLTAEIDSRASTPFPMSNPMTTTTTTTTTTTATTTTPTTPTTPTRTAIGTVVGTLVGAGAHVGTDAPPRPINADAEQSRESKNLGDGMDVDGDDSGEDAANAAGTDGGSPNGEDAHPGGESRSVEGGPKKKKEQPRFYCKGYGGCTLSFTRSEHLLRHIRKHTGERPYVCHCKREFSRLDNLRQHAQTIHHNEPIPPDSLANAARYPRQARSDRRVSNRARVGHMSATINATPIHRHHVHGRSRSLSGIANFAPPGGQLYPSSELQHRHPRPPPLMMPHGPYDALSPKELGTPPSATWSTGPGSPGWAPARHPFPAPLGHSFPPVPQGHRPFPTPQGHHPFPGPEGGHPFSGPQGHPFPSPEVHPASGPEGPPLPGLQGHSRTRSLHVLSSMRSPARRLSVPGATGNPFSSPYPSDNQPAPPPPGPGFVSGSSGQPYTPVQQNHHHHTPSPSMPVYHHLQPEREPTSEDDRRRTWHFDSRRNEEPSSSAFLFPAQGQVPQHPPQHPPQHSPPTPRHDTAQTPPQEPNNGQPERVTVQLPPISSLIQDPRFAPRETETGRHDGRYPPPLHPAARGPHDDRQLASLLPTTIPRDLGTIRLPERTRAAPTVRFDFGNQAPPVRNGPSRPLHQHTMSAPSIHPPYQRLDWHAQDQPQSMQQQQQQQHHQHHQQQQHQHDYAHQQQYSLPYRQPHPIQRSRGSTLQPSHLSQTHNASGSSDGRQSYVDRLQHPNLSFDFPAANPSEANQAPAAASKDGHAVSREPEQHMQQDSTAQFEALVDAAAKRREQRDKHE